jgi:hypothetical protein
MYTEYGKFPGWPVETPKFQKETNDDLSYYLQIQSSLSHIQGGVENRKWEEQLQLIETVKNDYTKQIDIGALVPTNNTSYLDFILDREISKLPELHLRMPTEVITIPIIRKYATSIQYPQLHSKHYNS